MEGTKREFKITKDRPLDRGKRGAKNDPYHKKLRLLKHTYLPVRFLLFSLLNEDVSY